MTLPANIRVNLGAPFPATVKGAGAVAVAKTGGMWTVQLSFGALGITPVIPDPANTYSLVWNALTGVYSVVPISTLAGSKIVKVLTAAGPYPALPNDDVLIIKQLVAAPFTVTVDWSLRSKPLRIVDGKGDAAINNITVTPAAGQSQMASVNFSYVIDGNGGSITLTPLPDGTGAY